MVAFVFPGQGAQKKGMGGTLFDEIREFKEIEPQVDAVLGYSLRELCLDDPDNLLNQTQYTQPALYTVNALHYFRALNEGKRPDYVAGHSLGEFNALLAAGVFDFITGLRLVKKRGALMSEADSGGMAAVIGLSSDKVSSALNTLELEGVDVANYNSQQQIVISGPHDQIKLAGPILEKAGAKAVMPLSVSAAFHSRYMSKAAKEFVEYARQFDYNSPSLPVIANITATPYEESEPDQHIPDVLMKQIAGSVLWQSSVEYILNAGEEDFVEIGPGNVLTRLIEQIRSDHQG